MGLLWHPYILVYLPKKVLMGLHRDCCSIRKNGRAVNYIPDSSTPTSYFFTYHKAVMDTLVSLYDINISKDWHNPRFWGEGKKVLPYFGVSSKKCLKFHTEDFLMKCIGVIKEMGLYTEEELASIQAEALRLHRADREKKVGTSIFTNTVAFTDMYSTSTTSYTTGPI